MKTFLFTLFTFPFCLFLLPNGQAQTVRMEIITPKDGLSQGYIGAMLQDKEGYLWFGTKNGLNRYDGRQFTIFTYNPFDSFSMPKDWVEALFEVGDFLLVGTLDGGLSVFHKKTQRFFQIESDSLPRNRGRNAHIRSVALDAQGNIWTWIVYENTPSQIFKIDLPQGFWTDILRGGNLSKQLKAQSLEVNDYTCFEMLKGGKELLVGKYDKILKINTQMRQVVPFDVLNAQAKSNFLNIHEDTEGGIWFLQERHLSCLKNNTWSHYPFDFSLNGGLFALESGRFWVHELGGLLAFALPQGSAKIERSKAVFHYPTVVNFSSHWCDRSGILWLGSAGHGVLKFNPKRNRIRPFFEGNPIYAPVYGGKNGQVGYYNFTTKQYELNVPNAALLQSLAIKSPELDFWQCRLWDRKDGGYWAYFENLECTGWLKIAKNGSLEKKYCVKPCISIRGNSMIDAQGLLWSAQDGQLVRFDPNTEGVKIFDFRHTGAKEADVYCLAETPNGVWWIGTSVGLVQATPEGEGFKFKIWQQKAGERNALWNNLVAALLPDPTDPAVLWIGTKGGGLARLNIENQQFTHWTSREGLPNDVIYGILTDDEHNLWMSTNKGIVRFNPKTGATKNFTEEDGLLNDELNTWAYAKSPTGELLFGGVNGLNVFHPKDLTDNPVLTQTHITGLWVNNKKITPNDSTGLMTEGVEFLAKLQLPFSQNNLTLQFAALEFSAPNKNRFRYYLEGAEAEWAHESSENLASYLNLASGTYTFKVKSANSDGVWNEKVSTLKIVILPPWYRSWWAYLAYFALAFWAVRRYLSFRERQLRLAHDLEMSHQEAHRLNELDAFKSRFFTNISHEFRTPLTVILGMNEKMKTQLARLPDTYRDFATLNNTELKNDLQKPIELIKRNSENLLRLINQILDLARLENNSLKINYLQGDIVAYIRYVVESIHSFANTRNVLVKVETAPSSIIMDYDDERLLQILYNLLANAVKFTPSGGRVVVSIGEVNRQLKIEVKDTGVGITKEDLLHVFDRFFKANNQNTEGGIGIGLSLTKELVKAMGGTISVDSVLGKETVFRVLLPIHNEAEIVDKTLIFNNLTTHNFLKIEQFTNSNEEKPRLLIVEDNADVIEYIASCLAENYQLDYAYNGRAGLEKALETTPDIIISDVMMPEMDGFMLCDKLKNDERTSHIPLVLLTAKATVEDRIAGLRRGADAYLAKPFHPEELAVTLTKLLDNQKRLQTYFSQFAFGTIEKTLPSSRDNTPTVSESIEDAFLIKLKTILEERMGKSDLSAEDVGKKLGMSRSNLYAKLSALTGLSFNLYLRDLRLQRAKKLLTTTEMNVSEVAYEVGYNNPSYFSRVFSEAFGISPTDFKTKRQ